MFPFENSTGLICVCASVPLLVLSVKVPSQRELDLPYFLVFFPLFKQNSKSGRL